MIANTQLDHLHLSIFLIGVSAFRNFINLENVYTSKPPVSRNYKTRSTAKLFGNSAVYLVCQFTTVSKLLQHFYTLSSRFAQALNPLPAISAHS